MAIVRPRWCSGRHGSWHRRISLDDDPRIRLRNDGRPRRGVTLSVTDGGAGAVLDECRHAVALVLSRKVSIYDEQVQDRFHSPAHLKDFTVDILENLRVGEVLDRLDGSKEALVSHEMPYFSLSALARRVGHLHFVVIDGTGALRGMARLDELELPDDEALRNLILIEDMLVEEVEPVYTSDDLHQALQKLLDSGFDKLPVVQRAHGKQESGLLGYLMYSDLLRLYDEEMARVERVEE